MYAAIVVLHKRSDKSDAASSLSLKLRITQVMSNTEADSRFGKRGGGSSQGLGDESPLLGPGQNL